jgi:hypothetical protein
MRRPLLALALAAGLAVAPVALARADDWHSDQPPAPPGSAIGAPVPLGPVGDIAFWAPNRGLLTTAGNDGVPAGLWAYDGSGWYELSTVCGGHDGRIAWAAANEWWTISDQPAGPGASQGPAGQTLHVSLCHFVDGQVVASYAEPLGTPSSYLPMNAAACAGPGDCWFAGDRLPGTTNAGAFHLHWDGHALTAVPSLTALQPDVVDPARTVAGLAFAQGRLYESVRVQNDDAANDPYLLHELLEDGSSNPFVGLFSDQPIDDGGVAPSQLAPLRLASGGGPLWAVAGATGGSAAHVTALRVDGETVTQLPLQDPGGTLPAGTTIAGVAAEPGSGAAWISYALPSDGDGAPARLARIDGGGTVQPPLALPSAADGIARKGGAGPIACPAAGQCWMATSQGWLFHLGPSLPQDADPAFHQLITFRPPDDSVPFVPPDSLPIDDSGANPPADQTPAPNADPPPPPRPRKARPLATAIRQRMLHRTTLELSFTLRARAHAQLVAERRGRVVAKTRRVTLAAGRHRLRLRLNPRRWPTKLDLRVSAAPAKGRR